MENHESAKETLRFIGAGRCESITVKELIKSETPLCLSIYDKEHRDGLAGNAVSGPA